VVEQKKDILHKCYPLVKYSDNVILLENNSSSPIIYEVETDLYEVSGKNQITLKPFEVGKYSYDIYCMRLGKK
jgi:hypothetical protein